MKHPRAVAVTIAIAIATSVVARPADDTSIKAPDALHNEPLNDTNVGPPNPSEITCPEPYVPGYVEWSGPAKTQHVAMCFNCGSGPPLGCDGACSADQTCDAYDNELCLPLSTPGLQQPDCSGVQPDQSIFNGSAPKECYVGGKSNEIRSEYIPSPDPTAKTHTNLKAPENLCKFLAHNCNNGTFSGARAFALDFYAGAEKAPAVGNTTVNGDFTGRALFAVKFEKNRDCGAK